MTKHKKEIEAHLEKKAQDEVIPKKSVDSSNIEAIGPYDPEENTLVIEFVGGGEYKYSNVPKSVYDELIDASSHGSTFWRLIRDNEDKYPYKKL